MMSTHRHTDPVYLQYIWDALEIHSSKPHNLEYVYNFIKNEKDNKCSLETVSQALFNALKDKCITIKSGIYTTNDLSLCTFKKDHDWYCFQCHTAGHVVSCPTCFRVYHVNCLIKAVETGKIPHLPDEVPKDSETIYPPPPCSPCSACIRLSQANQCINTSSSDLHNLMLIALERIKTKTSWRNLCTVGYHNELERNTYLSFRTINTRIITEKLRSDIKSPNAYHTRTALLLDLDLLVHNTSIIYGPQSEMANTSRQIRSQLQKEMRESSLCVECYLRCKGNNPDGNQIIQVCSKPHKLMWFHHSSWSFRPCKVIYGNADGYEVICFDGKREREFVPMQKAVDISFSASELGLRMTGSLKKALDDVEKYKLKVNESLNNEHTSVLGRCEIPKKFSLIPQSNIVSTACSTASIYNHTVPLSRKSQQKRRKKGINSKKTAKPSNSITPNFPLSSLKVPANKKARRSHSPVKQDNKPMVKIRSNMPKNNSSAPSHIPNQPINTIYRSISRSSSFSDDSSMSSSSTTPTRTHKHFRTSNTLVNSDFESSTMNKASTQYVKHVKHLSSSSSSLSSDDSLNESSSTTVPATSKPNSLNSSTVDQTFPLECNMQKDLRNNIPYKSDNHQHLSYNQLTDDFCNDSESNLSLASCTSENNKSDQFSSSFSSALSDYPTSTRLSEIKPSNIDKTIKNAKSYPVNRTETLKKNPTSKFLKRKILNNCCTDQGSNSDLSFPFKSTSSRLTNETQKYSTVVSQSSTQEKKLTKICENDVKDHTFSVSLIGQNSCKKEKPRLKSKDRVTKDKFINSNQSKSSLISSNPPTQTFSSTASSTSSVSPTALSSSSGIGSSLSDHKSIEASPSDPAISHLLHTNPLIRSIEERVQQQWKERFETTILERNRAREKITHLESCLSELQIRHKKELLECKRHSWCFVCLKEALYHCCGGIFYCSKNCQLHDWTLQHNKKCERSVKSERSSNVP